VKPSSRELLVNDATSSVDLERDNNAILTTGATQSLKMFFSPQNSTARKKTELNNEKE